MGRPATALGESSQYSCGNANLGVDSSLELLEAQRSMAEQQPEPPWGAIWINDNLLDTCVRKDELELFVAQQRARTDYVEAIAKIPYMLLYIDHLGLESLTASPGLAETHGGTGLTLIINLRLVLEDTQAKLEVLMKAGDWTSSTRSWIASRRAKLKKVADTCAAVPKIKKVLRDLKRLGSQDAAPVDVVAPARPLLSPVGRVR